MQYFVSSADKGSLVGGNVLKFGSQLNGFD
jgi:hypothetical protein